MTLWVLKTGPDDYEDVRTGADDGEPFGWTVSHAVNVGDRVVLYGTGTNKRFGFVGRVTTSPVLSEADGNWWSWIEWCRAHALSLAEARADPIFGTWPSLKMMMGGPRAVENARHRQRLLALVLADPQARATWEAWDASSDTGPAGPSLRFAERAHENDDGSGRTPELVLQRWIADELAEGWGYREARPSDGLPVPPSRHLGGAGYPDLLLIHPDRAKTIVVVEVKRAARPGPTTDGVTQLDEAYVPWLEDRLKGWTVVPWLIALHFSPEVLRRARDRGIECWQFDPDDREFYEPEAGS